MLLRAFIEGGAQLVATAPAQISIGAVAAQIVAANSRRKGLLLQNSGTTIIKIVLGGTDPTQTAYHIALAPCVAADDGKGGAYFDDAWVGPVRAISSAPGGTLVATEIEGWLGG